MMTEDSQPIFEIAEQASRDWADAHEMRLVDAVTRYYTPAAIDIFMSASRKVDNLGAIIAGRKADLLALAKTEAIDWGEYFVRRNQLWADLGDSIAYTYNKAIQDVVAEKMVVDVRDGRRFDSRMGPAEVMGRTPDGNFSVEVNGQRFKMPVNDNLGVPEEVAERFDANPIPTTAEIEQEADKVLSDMSRFGDTDPDTPYMGVAPQFKRGQGWKIHIPVDPDNYDDVTKFLDEYTDNKTKYVYKHLSGGTHEQGKDYTIYIGNRREMERVAQDIEDRIGDLIIDAPDGADVFKTDEQIGKLHARFDIAQGDVEGYFHPYGPDGIQWLARDFNQMQYGGGIDKVVAEQNARDELWRLYGERFMPGYGIKPVTDSNRVSNIAEEAGYNISDSEWGKQARNWIDEDSEKTYGGKYIARNRDGRAISNGYSHNMNKFYAGAGEDGAFLDWKDIHSVDLWVEDDAIETLDRSQIFANQQTLQPGLTEAEVPEGVQLYDTVDEENFRYVGGEQPDYQRTTRETLAQERLSQVSDEDLRYAPKVDVVKNYQEAMERADEAAQNIKRAGETTVEGYERLIGEWNEFSAELKAINEAREQGRYDDARKMIQDFREKHNLPDSDENVVPEIEFYDGPNPEYQRYLDDEVAWSNAQENAAISDQAISLRNQANSNDVVALRSFVEDLSDVQRYEIEQYQFKDAKDAVSTRAAELERIIDDPDAWDLEKVSDTLYRSADGKYELELFGPDGKTIADDGAEQGEWYVTSWADSELSGQTLGNPTRNVEDAMKVLYSEGAIQPKNGQGMYTWDELIAEFPPIEKPPETTTFERQTYKPPPERTIPFVEKEPDRPQPTRPSSQPYDIDSNIQVPDDIADTLFPDAPRASTEPYEITDEVQRLIDDAIEQDKLDIAEELRTGELRPADVMYVEDSQLIRRFSNETADVATTSSARMAEPLGSPNGTSARILGFAADGSSDTTRMSDELTAAIARSGNTRPPTPSAMADWQLEMSQALVNRIGDNVEEIMRGTPLTISDTERARIRQWTGENLYGAYDRATAAAMQHAEDMVSFSMIDYTGGRFIDDILGMFVPYHFWFTRSAKNWIERSLFNPGKFAATTRLVEGVSNLNEREDNPARYGGRIKIYTDSQGRSYHMREPVTAALPYLPTYLEGRYDDPTMSRTSFEEFQRVTSTLGFNLYPWLDAAIAYMDGRPEDISMMQWFPQTELLGLVGTYYQGSPVNGMPDWLPYLAGREAAYMSIRGELSDSSSISDTKVPEMLAVQQHLHEQATGGEKLPYPKELLHPENVDAAWKGAMYDRIFMRATQFFTGLSVSIQQPEDRVFREKEQEYFGMGFPETEYGSKLAQEGALREFPEMNVWWARRDIIPADQGRPYYPNVPQEHPDWEHYVGDGGVEFFQRSTDYDPGVPGITLGKLMRDEELDQMRLEMDQVLDDTIRHMQANGEPSWKINKTVFDIRSHYIGHSAEYKRDDPEVREMVTLMQQNGSTDLEINKAIDNMMWPKDADPDELSVREMIEGKYWWSQDVSEPEPWVKYKRMNPSEAALQVMFDLVEVAEKEFEDIKPGDRPQYPEWDQNALTDDMGWRERAAVWDKRRENEKLHRKELEKYLKDQKDYEEAVYQYIEDGLNDLSYLVELSGGYPMEESAVQELLDVLADEFTPLDMDPKLLNVIIEEQEDKRRPDLPDRAGLDREPGEPGKAAYDSEKGRYDTPTVRSQQNFHEITREANDANREWWTDKENFWRRGRAYRRRRWRRWRRWRYYRRYRRWGRRRKFWRRRYRKYRWNRWSNRFKRWRAWPRWARHDYSRWPRYPGYYNADPEGLPSFLRQGNAKRAYYPQSITWPQSGRQQVPIKAWSEKDIDRFGGS